ncbi:MAG: stage IV sporulation protein A [Christensenellales bacterium]|jgi:stage IV sporulation protein A
MQSYNLYKDISERTGGDIYIGVVGPVRTGKSTFIKRFMDMLVLPNLDDTHEKERVVDELPQSSAGKTIMTTQPKFVPNEAVKIKINNEAEMKVRMVDSVGYMVDGAMGHLENDVPRMVTTPWFDHDIPFEEAAETGTRKVITEHSTIGIVMTTDGSITEIPRSSYINAEERVIKELSALGKPFIIILNSANPFHEDTISLRKAMEDKYKVPVLLMDIMRLSENDISSMLENLLYEFPLKEINLDIPGWARALSPDHWLMAEVLKEISGTLDSLEKVRDYHNLIDAMAALESEGSASVLNIQLGEGSVNMRLDFPDTLFYKILGDECGYPIDDDYHLVSIVKDLVGAKKEYDRLATALRCVKETGYGLVPPSMEEMSLEEPEMVRQGSRFGVRLKASAPSLHLIRVDIETEVSPIVGTERQSEELIKYMMTEFENDPAKIWKTDIFGKSLHELVKEGLSGKLNNMPEDARIKIQETLQRIINEGSGGLICILL